MALAPRCGLGPGAGMATHLKSRTLRVAAAVLGGPRRLARRLDASPSEVLAWLSGSVEPPEQVFLQALRVILEDLEARDP